MSTNILSQYMTRKELAEELNYSTRTLEKWEALRIGPPVTRMGRRPLYSIESVKAWLKSNEKKMVRDNRGQAA